MVLFKAGSDPVDGASMQPPQKSSATLVPVKAAPRRDPAPDSHGASTHAQTVNLKGKMGTRSRTRLLLVEDDEPLRFALKARLHHRGFNVTEATDGVVARCSLLCCHYDAVILDLDLPKSHGLDVLTDVGARKDLPPIVVLTGGDEYERGLALTLGARLVLRKPCSFDVLAAALDRLLGR